MRYRLALTLSVSTTNDLLSQRLSVRGVGLIVMALAKWYRQEANSTAACWKWC